MSSGLPEGKGKGNLSRAAPSRQRLLTQVMRRRLRHGHSVSRVPRISQSLRRLRLPSSNLHPFNNRNRTRNRTQNNSRSSQLARRRRTDQVYSSAPVLYHHRINKRSSSSKATRWSRFNRGCLRLRLSRGCRLVPPQQIRATSLVEEHIGVEGGEVAGVVTLRNRRTPCIGCIARLE